MAVAGKTYVELANDAMLEAGVDQELIDHAAGPDPKIKLQKAFLKWVRDGWLAIQTSRSDWDWKVQQGIMFLNPRVLVRTLAAVNLATVISGLAGPVYFKTADGSLSLRAISAVPAREGAPEDTTYLYWFVNLYSDTTTTVTEYPELGGVLTVYNDAVATATTVYYISHGKYDLTVENPKLFNASISSIDLAVPGTGSATYFPLISYTTPFPYSASVSYNGSPYGAFVDPDGFLVFQHPLTEQVVIRLYYEPRPQELVEMSDIPEGLSPEFHDMISWRAVMHYAEHAKQSSLYMTAKQRYKMFESQVDRRHLPRVSFISNRF